MSTRLVLRMFAATAAAAVMAGSAFVATDIAAGKAARVSSHSKGSASRAPLKAKGRLNKSPIKLEVISFVNTPFGSVPQPFGGALGAARAINAAGGVNGHPIDVITCNNQYQPSVELNCAREAVTKGVTAMVGNVAFINTPADLAVWQHANIANVGSLPTVPQDFTSPINFPLGNFLSSVACVTQYPKVIHQTKIGSPLLTLAISQAGYALDAAAAKISKIDLFQTPVPNTATDMTSYVEALQTQGAKAIMLGLDPVKDPEFIKTAQSLGQNWDYCAQDGVLTGGQLEQLGSAVSHFYAGTVVPPLTAASKYPELRLFIKQMKAEQAAGDSAASTSVANYGGSMLSAWLGVQAVAQVAAKMHGPINHTTFLKAIRHATVSFGGVAPTIDFAKPDPIPQFARIFNPYIELERWNPTKKQFFLVPGTKPLNAIAAVTGH